jgi:putative Holliday junction resolvase
MRVMGLDIGEKRIGIAVADTRTRISTPLRVIDAHEVQANSRTWRSLLQDTEPEFLVFGLPKTLQGAQGRQASRVKEMAEKIAMACNLPYEFSDERLSSAEAKRYLRDQGLTERAMRGKVDSVAASLILQTWLDSRREEEMGK